MRTIKELIKEAHITDATNLNLNFPGIKLLPKEIGGLKKLKSLNLEGTDLVKLPKELSQLHELEHLNLSNTKIRELPTWVGNLKGLVSLNLSNTSIQDLPNYPGFLSLEKLNLSKTKFSYIPVHPFSRPENLLELDLSNTFINELDRNIRIFSGLKSLNIANTKIKDIPYEINFLVKLEYLNISGTKITVLPPELALLTNLNTFHFENAVIYTPPLEVLAGGIDSMRNYFEEIAIAKLTSELSKVFEAKMLVVGQGEVGKTHLLHRLIYNQLPDGATTEGIDIYKWGIDYNPPDFIRINAWDFGGQEIYHATHQFFLTKRSLYIFVWNARKDDQIISFDYWLNVIKILSDSSPVIMVLNKIDEKLINIDEASIQKKFPNIIAFHKVSALTGQGISHLIETIELEAPKLDHISHKLPKVWIDIRRKLESLDKNYITYSRYVKMCQDFGLNKSRADYLSIYYHILGVFLHFEGHPVLEDLIFLKPEWATNAAYKVINTKEIISKFGRFTYKELNTIWFEYPKKRHVHLLELMKKFELCFELGDEKTYIIPELLSEKPPDYTWESKENLQLEYHYVFMPAGIINRFAVRTHDLHKENLYWKNGVILERDSTMAEIRSEPLSRKIIVKIVGQNKKSLLEVIRREIDHIHKTLNKPEVKEMIPCKCSFCSKEEENINFFNYDDLKEMVKLFEKNVLCLRGKERVSIDNLIFEYLRPSDDIIKDYFSIKIPNAPKPNAPKKKKWYKTAEAIILFIIAILGGILTIINIFDSDTVKSLKKDPKLEIYKQDTINPIFPTQKSNFGDTLNDNS